MVDSKIYTPPVALSFKRAKEEFGLDPDLYSKAPIGNVIAELEYKTWNVFASMSLWFHNIDTGERFNIYTKRIKPQEGEERQKNAYTTFDEKLDFGKVGHERGTRYLLNIVENSKGNPKLLSANKINEDGEVKK
jgi:hypothetical protein